MQGSHDKLNQMARDTSEYFCNLEEFSYQCFNALCPGFLNCQPAEARSSDQLLSPHRYPSCMSNAPLAHAHVHARPAPTPGVLSFSHPPGHNLII